MWGPHSGGWSPVRYATATDALAAAVKMARLSSFSSLSHCAKILRVVDSDILRYAELGAQEGGADFGDKLLGGVRGIAKALAHLAVKAMLCTSPVC